MLRSRATSLPTQGNTNNGAYTNSNSYSGGGYYDGGASYGGYNGGNDMTAGYGGAAVIPTSAPEPSKRKRDRNPSFQNHPLLLLTGLWWNLKTQQMALLKDLQLGSPKEVVEMIRRSKIQLLEMAQRVESTKAELTKSYTGQLSTLEKQNHYLQKERDELRIKYEGPDNKVEEEMRLRQREQAFQEQVATCDAQRIETKYIGTVSVIHSFMHA
jgi:hypothetical protein